LLIVVFRILFYLLAILLSSTLLYIVAGLFPDHFFVGEEEQLGFWTYVYFTATTLTTVGYGDFLPRIPVAGFAYLMVAFALSQFADVLSRIVVEQWLGFTDDEVEETVPVASDEESALPN
jgi:voltage-gated potassium channel Kch